MEIPVYFFTGFLESGKTTFLMDVLTNQDFTEGKKALVIACEEGEVELDSELLADLNCDLVYIDDKEDFNTYTLNILNAKHKPEIVLVEFNGMWPFAQVMGDIDLPENWAVAQIVSTIDASTFGNYLNNMRSIIFEQLVDSEMIIFNRCDPQTTEKSFLRSNVRAINRAAQIIYECKDGSVNTLPEDDLPFDKNSDYIVVKDEDFGLWYSDALEHSSDYIGKKVEVRGLKFEPIDDTIADVCFVLGRYAMVCCADDLQPIGFLCYFQGSNQLMDEENLRIVATMDEIFDEDFGRDVPILKVESMKVLPPMQEDIVYFN